MAGNKVSVWLNKIRSRFEVWIGFFTRKNENCHFITKNDDFPHETAIEMPHRNTPLGVGFDHIKMQQLTISMSVKDCSLTWPNPSSTSALLWPTHMGTHTAHIILGLMIIIPISLYIFLLSINNWKLIGKLRKSMTRPGLKSSNHMSGSRFFEINVNQCFVPIIFERFWMKLN